VTGDRQLYDAGIAPEHFNEVRLDLQLVEVLEARLGEMAHPDPRGSDLALAAPYAQMLNALRTDIVRWHAAEEARRSTGFKPGGVIPKPGPVQVDSRDYPLIMGDELRGGTE
jgi:hypothetical protein